MITSTKILILLPKILKEIIANDDDVIFLASYVPTALLKDAKEKGFSIMLLQLSINVLNERNKKRMAQESYQDATPWLQMQLDNFSKLQSELLIDKVIDGNQPVEIIASELV